MVYMYMSLNVFINMFQPYTYTIVSWRDVSVVYDIQEKICLLIIIFLVIGALFELRYWSKIVMSIIALSITILHYYVLYLVSRYLEIIPIPFAIIEVNDKGSAVSIDYGQLMILFLIIIWRSEVRKGLTWIRELFKKWLSRS